MPEILTGRHETLATGVALALALYGASSPRLRAPLRQVAGAA